MCHLLSRPGLIPEYLLQLNELYSSVGRFCGSLLVTRTFKSGDYGLPVSEVDDLWLD